MGNEVSAGYSIRRGFAGLCVGVMTAWAGAGLGVPALGQCTTLTAGANVDVSQRSGNESEAAIAIDPTNTQRMFFLSNVDSGSLLRCGYSTDGGLTWSKRNFANGSDGLTAACCDGSCSWDAFGNLFVCYISSSGSRAIIGLSTNGGASFTQVASLTGVSDQPTLTTGAGMVWLCYKSSSGISARGATVTGLGVVGAFSAAQTAPGSSAGNFGDISIGPAGQVMVCYQNNTGGQGLSTIFVNVDPDGLGAAGFGSAITVTTCNVGGFDYIPAQATRSVDSESGLAWDRSGGVHNGRVYMVYTDETPDESNNTDIYVRYSDNNGSAWSGAVKANDDGTTRSQFLPRIALDQTTGNIAVSWHDARNSAANNTAQLYATVSTNGGATFFTNVLVGSGVANSNTAGNGIDFGDYTGLAFHAGRLFPIWADNSGAPAGNPSLPQLDIVTAPVTLANTTPAAPTGAYALAAVICPGEVAQLFATVPGGQTIDWYAGACGLGAVQGVGNGATVMPGATTTYYGRARVISGGCVGTACAAVTVTVGAAPVIGTQPTPVSVPPGSAAVFTIGASGPGVSGALAYQWRVGGVPLTDGGAIIGATTSTLTIDPVTIAENGAPLDCEVMNTCGVVFSDAVVLTVTCQPSELPAITQQPQAVSTCPPHTAAFTVGATGLALTYQWQRESFIGSEDWEPLADGADPELGTLTGADGPTLTIADSLRTAYGNFRCVVSGPCGLADSAPVRLYMGAADIGQQGGSVGFDGLYDNNDFVVFIDRFFAQDPIADLGQQGGTLGADGLFDNNDFVVFIDDFFNHSGCP